MATPQIIASNEGRAVSIQRMTEHDLLEVVEIEELSGLSPWGWEAYYRELSSAADVIMLVAKPVVAFIGTDAGKELAGFVVARLIVDELHINNIAVRPNLRREGIGRQLLQQALDWGQRKGAKRALLEVRAGNQAAQALYGGRGFQVTGRRRRYYRMPLEDALIMTVTFG